MIGSKGRTLADSGVVLSQVFIPFIENITLGISKANGDSDLVDLKLLTICGCCRHLLYVGARSLCKKIVDLGDQNGRNRHPLLIVVTHTFRLLQPSPTSM